MSIRGLLGVVYGTLWIGTGVVWLSAGCQTESACPCIGIISPACQELCQERTDEVVLPLSVGLSAYTITSQNLGTAAACNDPNNSSWCKCGTDYTDNAPRCNTPADVLFWRVPALNGSVATATLSYQVSTYSSAASDVAIHRILRLVTDPPMGSAGLCATTPMASWYRSGPQSWTTAGAGASGADRSIENVVRHYPGNTGVRTETFDVAAMIGSSCASGCVLAQYATGGHVNVLGGTSSLVYTLGSAAVCGDGTVGGAETCDDGNTAAADGCSAACLLETGWACSGTPSFCSTTCGDGLVAGGEQCDHGVLNGPTDTCSATCITQVCSCQ